MEKKSSLLQFTMTYGLILGIALIIFSLALYMMDVLPSNMKLILLTSIVNIALMVVLVVMGSRAYRDKVLGGTITYGNAFLTGLLIVIFSSIITGFYTLIFNSIIDPEYMDKVFEATKNWTADYLNNMGLPDSQIDQSLERIEKQQANYNALKAFFTGIAWSAVFGVIVSLITSAFVKKNPNPVA